MPENQDIPTTIDEYIASFTPEVQARLQEMRAAICKETNGF